MCVCVCVCVCAHGSMCMSVFVHGVALYDANNTPILACTKQIASLRGERAPRYAFNAMCLIIHTGACIRS